MLVAANQSRVKCVPISDLERKGMRLTKLAILAASLGGIILLTSGVDAAPRKRQKEDYFYYTAREREARYAPRARITVQRRSYLDPGPALAPGASSYKYREYAEPFGYSALDNVYPNQTWNRNPFNSPFDVPAYAWPGRF
jgi:hypothetical protein